MRNIFVIFSLLDLFIFSTLIASPVNDFLNPEKRRKPTASSPKKDTEQKPSHTPENSSQKTVSDRKEKRNPQT